MPKTKQIDKRSLAATPLREHFGQIGLAELVTARRQFPTTSRSDLQRGLYELFAQRHDARLLGLHRSYNYAALSFSDFLDTQRDPVLIAPLQHDEVDIGDPTAARCLKQGLWICRSNGLPFAVLLATCERYGEPEGVTIEIAVPAGEEGLHLSHSFLDELERLVSRGGCYRGKVISLEGGSRYSGKAGVVRVHKLHAVSREDVILPARTLQLLERNVTEFIQQRAQLRALGIDR